MVRSPTRTSTWAAGSGAEGAAVAPPSGAPPGARLHAGAARPVAQSASTATLATRPMAAGLLRPPEQRQRMVQNTPMGDANCAEERPADPAPDERHGRRPERPFRPPRGVPLVATWTRWAASASAVAAGLVLLAEGCVLVAHSGRTLASFGGWLVLACAVQAPLVLALLRAEELRLSRELRTARTGTPALRAMVAHRRAQAPFFARSFSSGLGTAAVLLADGE